ncbi:hypothetical protein LTSESEN_1764 [Salmonella enterica subsp. enterica serovar Senftenberg str. A4-543]|uniref:Uncharacterized protein n=1 Tax=Salmonella enterica subsp. enterica serovar Senftenberg str. A4-543 TaxID=913082 RepID=G5QY69_SALSE|nr:hypothetical protein LTSESEN_1764 [Salmonella enterica subsp. enterica serovar Senftenberg str. A4-543]
MRSIQEKKAGLSCILLMTKEFMDGHMNGHQIPQKVILC